jgi:hypothetical protein
MEMQPASDQTAFIRPTMQAGGVNSGEDCAPEVSALREDREQRRVQFRLSLLKARAVQAGVEGREMAQQSVRQLSAGFLELRPAHMMADLANAQ